MRLYKVQRISAICGSILYSAAFEFGLYHLLHLRSASRISSVVERLLSRHGKSRVSVRSAITFRAKFREIPRKWPFGQHETRKFRAKFHEITWNPRSVSRAYFPRWRPPWKKFGECIIVHLKDYCRFPF